MNSALSPLLMPPAANAMSAAAPAIPVSNEDDHYNFEVPNNPFTSALSEYAGWGYFDFRMRGEGFTAGFRSVPADWGINSPRKRGFFRLPAERTGHTPDLP